MQEGTSLATFSAYSLPEPSYSSTCEPSCFPLHPLSQLATRFSSLLVLLRIVDGQVLYRDFFELVTPGTDLLYALGFRIFGVHAWLMQAWAIALGLALSCVITLIAARIVRGRWFYFRA